MDNTKEEQWDITDIKTINFKYSWTINNFSFNRKETGQFIRSPSFYLPDRQNYEWCLSLYPKGLKEEYKDNISISLNLYNAPVNPDINTKVTMAILDSKNEEKNTGVLEHCFNSRGGRGFPKFIKLDSLSKWKNHLLPDDKLTIVCRITAGREEMKYFSKDIVTFEDKRNDFQFRRELESLLKNQHMTNVTLIADGKELKAHKTILAARSPVFLAMLQTDMQEKQTSRIEFADVSVDVLNEMLQYLYSGKVQKIKDFANDLVKLADKYDIQGLKLLCEEVFHRELCINNAIKLFILADRYNCAVLRPLILKFMIANAKDIMKTVDFKKFENDLPILIREMMQAII